MPDDYVYELMQRFDRPGGWPGMTHDDLYKLLGPTHSKPSEEPTSQDINQWELNECEARFFRDIVVTLKLTSSEQAKLDALQSGIGSRSLHDEEIDWLVDLVVKKRGPKYLLKLLARFWQERSIYKNDVVYLSRASRCWRLAQEPQFALLSLKSAKSNDKRKMSIIWTARAGAYRDLEEVSAAKLAAQEAIRLDDKKFHPFAVLWAIAYHEGDFKTGDHYYKLALERGQQETDSRPSIQKILRSMTGDERQSFAAHLIQNGWL